MPHMFHRAIRLRVRGMVSRRTLGLTSLTESLRQALSPGANVKMVRIDGNQKRTALSWLFVAALLALCGVLGGLQYRWTGEVSVAEHERLRKSLQTSLDRLSQDLNAELGAAWQSVAPTVPPANVEDLANELPA